MLLQFYDIIKMLIQNCVSKKIQARLKVIKYGTLFLLLKCILKIKFCSNEILY